MSDDQLDSACTLMASQVIEDVRRAREFYSYLQPDNLIQPHLRRRQSTFDGNNRHVPSLSASLAPYCQLTALRCNAIKAMLNVMDRDVMYFLAESTRKRREGQQVEIYDFVEDPILLACSAVPLKGRICELTIRQDVAGSEEHRTFVIPDLTKSQFAHMSIVDGPPYYRFYAGVPITTRDGINMGSLAIMDDKERPQGLTQDETEFLWTTAQQIMLYLETNRQAIEGRRSRRLAEGLEAFIANKESMHEDRTRQATSGSRRKARQVYGIHQSSDEDDGFIGDSGRSSRNRMRPPRRSGSSASISSTVSGKTTDTETASKDRAEAESDSRSHARTFARAANILRECMGDLGDDGSVHIVSTKPRFASNATRRQAAHRKVSTDSAIENLSSSQGPAPALTRATIIAASTKASPFWSESKPSTESTGVDDATLRDLIKRYPSGHLWSLEDFGGSSSEEEAHDSRRETSAKKSDRRSRRKRSEMKRMRDAYPRARQVLFAPLWDSTIGAAAHGVFVTTTLETRSFSTVSDLSFLNSFSSTVMGECSRLDTMAADKQKSDFVGTISHEMRSPLHGVLASVEFLADTDMNGFQKSLIDTIDSCGRTLLDTINHVLDFSKVNSFQKQWEASNKKDSPSSRQNHFLSPENASKSIANGAPPLLQLFGVTDVSAVLEEVVDGLVLGQTYTSGVDFTDLSREARGRGKERSDDATAGLREPVEILLDVEQADWTFMTQPGAVRRIIMNITGNAMKYTSNGSINIRLRLQATENGDDRSEAMVLTVVDTGRGISPEFLASKLFVPFAQENALAPGTGLGMSIVRSIVLMLGGTIDVSSTIGKGTTVEVILPMTRPLPGQVSTQNTPLTGGTAGSGSSVPDDSIQLLQNQAADATVVYYRKDESATRACARIVQQYVEDWYHLRYGHPQLVASASVVIVDGEDLEELLEKAVGTPGRRPALVVLCSVLSRHSASLITSVEQRLGSAVEFLARPCGPYKLARSIRLVLEKMRAIYPRFPQVTNLGSIEEAVTPMTSTTESSGPGSGTRELQEMDLNTPGSNDAARFVQANETFAASQASQHAQNAINDSRPSHSPSLRKLNVGDGFPFPDQIDDILAQTSESKEHATLTHRPSSSRRDIVDRGNPEQDNTPLPPVKSDPNFLLVDDNNINLKLLETFLKTKRKYRRMTSAGDGQQAVDAVKSAQERFDIIFMDISMPVMNGFEATRAIREYEEQNNIKPGAMVIALTGLANGRDQSEGFDSGCDIYMTKPVSFKEVAKLLDNWEEHRDTNATELGTKPGLTDTINRGH